MADYRFNKPWAAESQNVQEFTEGEWGTGIVEKSLVSSSQVNGVMQAVTRRFLDLEAVEDRQYRYDFVIENQAQWNKFINNNIGNAQSVLIRKGQVWTAANAVTLQRVGVIAQEEGAEIRFNGGLNRNSQSPVILSGGVIRGDLTNCRVLYATVTATRRAIYENTVFENSYVYTESSTVSLSDGHYSRSVINCTGRIMNAKLTDCKINNIYELTNCTIVRCEIPNNTKLTNCTVIDCQYKVNRYIANLVTGTTFRNCNISFETSAYGGTAAICNKSNKAYGSTITFSLGESEHVSMLIYDSEIKYYSIAGIQQQLFTDSIFFGKSFMDVAGEAISTVTSMLSKFATTRGSILTDVPFLRNGGTYYVMSNETTISPGVINAIGDNNNRTVRNSLSNNKYFIAYSGYLSYNTSISYGTFKFYPWFEFTQTLISQQYNLEFVLAKQQ